MNRYSLAGLAAALAVLTPAAWIPSASATALPPSSDPVPTEIAAASVTLGGLNLATSYLNLNSRGSDLSPRWAGYVGLAGGVAGILFGGALLVEDEYEHSTPLGVSSLLVGSFATIAGISAIGRAKKASDTAGVHEDPGHVSIAPAFHGGMAPGVGLRLRF